jgi:hypothetical protein
MRSERRLRGLALVFALSLDLLLALPLHAASSSLCVLPSIAAKGEGVPDSLRVACVKDGGKVSQQNGATTCVAS